jgi:two-component system nitrate/nitrite sensor histidine kinase NarX
MGIEHSGKPVAVESGRGAETAILAQITADLAVGTGATELLQRFLAPVARICGAEAGAMRTLSVDGRSFELVADIGLSPEARAAEMTVDAGCGVCGSAAGTLEVAFSDASSPCAQRSHPLFGAGCRRVLAVPLAHRGQVLGVCNLFLAPEVIVAPQVAALLKTLGELLGLALHGARLEREVLRATVVAERQLMAAEVHDSIAQTLAYAKMRMPLLESAIAAGDQGTAQRYCADLRRAVGEAHGGLRDVLGHLRDPMPETDFRHALQASKQVLQERAAVELAVDDRAGELHLSAPQEHQVQRIVQEALNNIARHAGARHAWLTIERCGSDLEILVDDDGSGFEAAPKAGVEGHFGLGIMRQRAAILGGAIEFARRQGGGTRVRLRFPVPSALGQGAPA